jgi:uncharacterized protein YjbI with pentapeptide repeats
MAEITREELLTRYKTGERDFSGLDFSGLDLSGIRDEELLSQDCYASGRRNYPLSHCIFRGANFSYVNFSNWTHIRECDFRDTIFFRANLRQCAFSGANFTGADMREVIFGGGEGIGVIFENVDFRGCGEIGNFVNERTLCLRNCIGQDGRLVERTDVSEGKLQGIYRRAIWYVIGGIRANSCS